MSTKLRILCLHGYRQNGVKLRGRIAAFRRAFKSSIDFVCVDAPIVVPYEPSEEEKQSGADMDAADVEQYSWFNFNTDEETGKRSFTKVEESIDYLAEICKEHGPFDGILGFSQGGMIASLLLQRQQFQPESYPDFKFWFGMFISAVPTAEIEGPAADKLNFPTLHIMGKTDQVVAFERSQELAETFVEPQVFEHPGGHYIPTYKDVKDAMRTFMKKRQEERTE